MTDAGKALRIRCSDVEGPVRETADLYERRWKIELLFRRVRQDLQFRHFLVI